MVLHRARSNAAPQIENYRPRATIAPGQVHGAGPGGKQVAGSCWPCRGPQYLSLLQPNYDSNQYFLHEPQSAAAFIVTSDTTQATTTPGNQGLARTRTRRQTSIMYGLIEVVEKEKQIFGRKRKFRGKDFVLLGYKS